MKILVPLDGSPLSEKALPYALDWATRSGASLRLLRTTKGNLGPVKAYLNTVATRLEGVEVSVVAEKGAADKLILQHSHDCEAIVMSGVGQSGSLEDWLLGTVTSRVVRAAPCPVLVLAGEALNEADTVGFQRVLIPLDGSDISRAALPVASKVLPPEGEVILYRALVISEAPSLPHAAAAAQAERQAAEESLKKDAERIDHENVRIHMTAGTPTRALIAAARDLKADLVVMTTHGLSGFVRFICGSVTESLLHAGICPVLVVNPRAVKG